MQKSIYTSEVYLYPGSLFIPRKSIYTPEVYLYLGTNDLWPKICDRRSATEDLRLKICDCCDWRSDSSMSYVSYVVGVQRTNKFPRVFVDYIFILFECIVWLRRDRTLFAEFPFVIFVEVAEFPFVIFALFAEFPFVLFVFEYNVFSNLTWITRLEMTPKIDRGRKIFTTNCTSKHFILWFQGLNPGFNYAWFSLECVVGVFWMNTFGSVVLSIRCVASQSVGWLHCVGLVALQSVCCVAVGVLRCTLLLTFPTQK